MWWEAWKEYNDEKNMKKTENSLPPHRGTVLTFTEYDRECHPWER